MDTPKTDAAMGTDPINTANIVTGGTPGGADTLGAGNSNTGDIDTTMIPTGSHGGGMESGAGLDADAVEDAENEGETVTTSGRLDGANSDQAETDDEQTGTVGTGQTTTVGGGI